MKLPLNKMIVITAQKVSKQNDKDTTKRTKYAREGEEGGDNLDERLRTTVSRRR